MSKIRDHTGIFHIYVSIVAVQSDISGEFFPCRASYWWSLHLAVKDKTWPKMCFRLYINQFRMPIHSSKVQYNISPIGFFIKGFLLVVNLHLEFTQMLYRSLLKVWQYLFGLSDLAQIKSYISKLLYFYTFRMSILHRQADTEQFSCAQNISI